MIDRRSLRFIAAAAAAPLLLACSEQAPPPVQAVPVTVGKAELRTVPYMVQANGTVEPMQTVAIEPQVGGIITKILFKEGDDVKEGQPLFEIDPRSYQATLASDEAMAQQARLNLQYATIRAPISGRAGSLQVRVGYLARIPAATPLVTINQIHPILVRFAVPAASLQRIRQYASTSLPVSAHPASSPGVASTGTLSFVDNAIDTTTGTILLKGTFENKDGALWPGEFVTATLQLFQQQNAIVVPTQAVVEGQNGNFLFVINADSTATQREITIDRAAGDVTIISQGVKPGEQVVTDGQLRLNTGTKVQIKPPAGGDQQRAG